MQALEIEIDGPHNEALHFAPLQRSIRGRYDLMRIGSPEAVLAAQKWAGPLPSQRLGIDPDGIGFISEPLHEPQHSANREKIVKQGMTLEPPVQQFQNIDLASWLFWIKRAVESGLARVVKGQLPETIDGTPRLNYILAEPQPNTADKLTTALTEQTAAFNRLTDALLQSLAKK